MILDKRIPVSYLFKKVRFDMSLSIGFVFLIILFKQLDVYALTLPVAVPAFLGTAISLVLAFKLNQSYDRWWEARKIWGAIVNDSRTLVVQVLNFCQMEINSEKKDAKLFAYRQMAWCYALTNSLRKLNPTDTLDNFLTKIELEEIQLHTNIPLKLIDLHSQHLNCLLKEKKVNEFQQIQIDSTLVRLMESMGKAERIKNTVFPKTYRIFLHFFIYIFIFTLAISLSDLNPFFEVVLLAVIALSFFLLEKTAFHMQDPFENRPTDTAMSSISRTIEMNLKQLLGEKYESPKGEVEKFYIM